MGRLEINGIDALMSDFAALAELPDSVIEDILNAEADVIEKAQKEKAQSMGVYDTGITAESIKRTKVKKAASGSSLFVYPQGKNVRGDRNAEVAFVNEYGKEDQPARPFIRTANEEAGDETVQEGEKVYHKFLDSKNL